MILLLFTAVFLILLVLVQRGRGGGLAGAFGGMGGQSAFGTKAGDLFTRITIVVATCWILLCLVSIKMLSSMGEVVNVDTTQDASGAPGFLQTVPSLRFQLLRPPTHRLPVHAHPPRHLGLMNSLGQQPRRPQPPVPQCLKVSPNSCWISHGPTLP